MISLAFIKHTVTKLKPRLRILKRVHGERAGAFLVAVLFGLTGVFMMRGSHAATVAVPGQSYNICDLTSTYLTSPYTYHALASGSQDYTVAEYEALPGYGTTLPALPSYISDQGPTASAATIYAPGSTTDLQAWQMGDTPTIQFFEGGAYGALSMQAVNGDMFIGGSTAGYPEPQFDDGGGAGGISAQNDSYGYNAGPTLISHVATAVSKGSTTVTLTSSTLPLMPWASIHIGSSTYTPSAVTGTQSGGYTLTIDGGLDEAAAANAPVYYGDAAGAVTVSYLDITNDLHNTTGTFYTGAGWEISHNNVHDGYSATSQDGIAVYGGDEGVIEYNCFARMGVYAANIFGHNNKFRMNEVRETNYEVDNSGNGQAGGGKWWGTLNADITDNYWYDNSPGGSLVIWLDNGNVGTNISGNYFDKSAASAIMDETGFNISITNNIFQDGGWGTGSGCGDSNCVGAVNLNSSGGFHVPGSRYDNQMIISGNQFINNWGGIDIWQSGGRSCENSGEGWPEDADYCSGGFPITQEASAGGQYYFSHYGSTTNQGGYTLTQAASAGSTTVQIGGAAAINDYVGFADPAKTTTTATTNVTTLNGSQSINAANTSSFPSSGQLRVGTTAAWDNAAGSATGAILSYTGKTASSFTGVSFVRGSGSLTGPLWQVQPYKVTSETCYANDCVLTVTPALTASVSAGSVVTNAGTCQLYATSAATPTSPLAPNGTSYYDGCQWGTKNIQIHDNTFSWDPNYIASGTTVSGHVGTTCTAAHADSCGTNFQSFQEAGDAPFNTFINGNSMMSNSQSGCPTWDSSCTTNPLSNINNTSNPPSAPANNGEPPNNILWYNNTYTGSWLWNVYWYGTCGTGPSDPTTGKSMPSPVCQESLATWQSNWQMDTASVVAPGYIAEDINQDGHVTIADFNILAANYGKSGASITNTRADIDGNGTVNIADFNRLAAKYGT